MSDQRTKPVYGMRNAIHAALERVRWELADALEAAEDARIRAENASKALNELMDEDGPVFQRVRCDSCRSSWVDEREQPKVTHCPSCGVEHK